MRLQSPGTVNQFRKALDEFSVDNRNLSFNHIRGINKRAPEWQATTRFKVTNNDQTNKIKGFIDFYSKRDLMLNLYGNNNGTGGVNLENRFWKTNSRPLFANRHYELKTSQYRVLGQEFAEYETIEYVDASGRLEIEAQDMKPETHQIFHDYGDAPVEVCAGYFISGDDGSAYYVIGDEPVSVQIQFNAFDVVVNDSAFDIRTFPQYKTVVSDSTTLAYGATAIGEWYSGMNANIAKPQLYYDPEATHLQVPYVGKRALFQVHDNDASSQILSMELIDRADFNIYDLYVNGTVIIDGVSYVIDDYDDGQSTITVHTTALTPESHVVVWYKSFGTRSTPMSGRCTAAGGGTYTLDCSTTSPANDFRRVANLSYIMVYVGGQWRLYHDADAGGHTDTVITVQDTDGTALIPSTNYSYFYLLKV